MAIKKEMKKEKIFKNHKNRKDLAGEHALGDIGQVVLLLIFLAVWIIDSFFIKFSILVSNYVFVYIRISLSIIILFIAGYLAKSGLSTVFADVRERPIVIRKGVFNIVRHPIYLGAILFYLGLLIFSFSIIATFIWTIIISLYLYLSKHEEKLLIEKFGRDYEEYMKEVPMLIPRINRK